MGLSGGVGLELPLCIGVFSSKQRKKTKVEAKRRSIFTEAQTLGGSAWNIDEQESEACGVREYGEQGWKD